MPKITYDGAIAFLKSLGWSDEEINDTTKVTIVIQSGHVPMMYVERYGTDHLLHTMIEHLHITKPGTPTNSPL
jgi:hypothetical protein